MPDLVEMPAEAQPGPLKISDDIIIYHAAGKPVIQLGTNAVLTLGGSGRGGRLTLKTTRGGTTIDLVANEAGLEITLGQSGRIQSGGLTIKSADGKTLADFSAIAQAGGILQLSDEGGNQTVALAAPHGYLHLGSHGKNGNVVLFPADAASMSDFEHSTAFLSSHDARLSLGGNGTDGSIVLFPQSASIVNPLDRATIHLDASAGDIILRNADCAEDFEVSDARQAEPGSVMVIDGDGKLRQSTDPYDRRVAGVVSGAASLRPGIVLGRVPSSGQTVPVALAGKVFCKVDANPAPVQVGDLLTTSAAPGHAMKATDPARAFGAVIGKALLPFDGGQGLIPVLVGLQ